MNLDFVGFIDDSIGNSVEDKAQMLEDYCMSGGYKEGNKKDFANELMNNSYKKPIRDYRYRQAEIQSKSTVVPCDFEPINT